MRDQRRATKIVNRSLIGGVAIFLLWIGFRGAASGLNQEGAVPSLGNLEPALVPTLGQWGLLLLALTMMGVAFWVIRRNSASKG